MGSQAARTLVASDLVRELVVADHRQDAATALAFELGPRAEARFVDASQYISVREALRGADLVVNCVGPFYKYAAALARTAAAARVHYVDICDDPDALTSLLAMDKSAQREEVTILTGVGWTPGISNMLAVQGAAGLEGPLDIRIAWVGTAADSKGLAVIQHLLHAIDGEVPMWRDGRVVKVPARSGREYVEFPPPLDRAVVYYCGHPEPLTLPRALPQVRKVTLKGGLKPDWVNRVGGALAALGLCGSAESIDVVSRLLHRLEFAFRGDAAPISGVRVDVSSTKTRTTRTLAVMDRMARLTGISVAVAAILMLEKKVTRKGVVFPEEVLDPKEFFGLLKTHGIEVYEWE